MDAFGHKADKSKVNVGDMLSANGKEFYFDYQNGQYGFNTDPDRGATTFIPFRTGGVTDLGTFAATNGTTINISTVYADYQNITKSDILIVPVSLRAGAQTYANGNRSWTYSTATFSYTYNPTTGIITISGKATADDTCSYGTAEIYRAKVIITA